MLQEFVRLAPDLMVKVNASNIGDIKRWMKVCTPSVVEVSTENITPAFRYFAKAMVLKLWLQTLIVRIIIKRLYIRKRIW